MSTTLSVQEAQAQLPALVARAAQDAEPCFIESNGKAVAVLVGARRWQRRERSNGNAPKASAKGQERHVRAYQKKMKQLGPNYWLPPDQQARLKELIEKEDLGTPLTPAERKELRQLLKRHEQLMVKRASAMQAIR
jgi:prevent-host-death family protein